MIFKAIIVEYDLKYLHNYYSAHQSLDGIKKYIMENDLYDVFVCPFKFNENGVPTTGKYLNLLDGIWALKIETVKKATALYKLNTFHKYYPQTIFWSGDNIINSCDE